MGSGSSKQFLPSSNSHIRQRLANRGLTPGTTDYEVASNEEINRDVFRILENGYGLVVKTTESYGHDDDHHNWVLDAFGNRLQRVKQEMEGELAGVGAPKRTRSFDYDSTMYTTIYVKYVTKNQKKDDHTYDEYTVQYTNWDSILEDFKRSEPSFKEELSRRTIEKHPDLKEIDAFQFGMPRPESWGPVDFVSDYVYDGPNRR
jgi:hypothetical protein